MSEGTQLLFVYGTLLPGLRLHHAMQGAVSLGAARVRGRLYDLGTYPGLVWGEGEGEVNGVVSGEVYRVNAAHLVRLDQIEEMIPHDPQGSLYWREPVAVLDGACAGQAVWTYRYNRAVDEHALIAHGDYRRHVLA